MHPAGGDGTHAQERSFDLPLFGNELFGGSGNDYLIGDGGTGFDQGQSGCLDQRIDWIDSLEHLIEDCVAYDKLAAFLGPAG